MLNVSLGSYIYLQGYQCQKVRTIFPGTQICMNYTLIYFKYSQQLLPLFNDIKTYTR